MGLMSYCLSLSLQITSSCLRRYSVLMNLILQMHAGQRSMCGVILVDAEQFWSTSHGRDAYIHDHCLRCLHNYSLFYQLLDSNSFTHCNTYASLREASSETYGPRVYSPSYKFPIYFYFAFFTFNLYHKNTKNIYLIISIRSHFCKWP